MEMDGYSVYMALRGMDNIAADTKKLWSRSIIAAVQKRMRECAGFFSHPVWSGSEQEIHFRFTAAAVKLMIEGWRDGLVEKADAIDLLDRHLRYRETLPIGVWFLHDSLELADTVAKDPARPSNNHAWGSSARNCMVLNTHLDALSVLLYAAKVGLIDLCESDEHRQLVLRGLDSLTVVLQENPGRPWQIFSFLDRFVRGVGICSYAVPTKGGSFTRKVLRRTVFAIRKQFRSRYFGFVHSDGYVERDISLWGMGFEYHIVNLYDLVRLIELVSKSEFACAYKKQITDWLKIVDNAIDHATRHPYKFYLEKSFLDSGRSICLCEALLVRISLSEDFVIPKRWAEIFFYICSNVPPSAAMLGVDPFIVKNGSLNSDNTMTYELLNGARLNVNFATRELFIERSEK